jgi:hypothetical protein
VPGLFLLGSLRRIISKSPFFGLNIEHRTSNVEHRIKKGECSGSKSSREVALSKSTTRKARLFKTSEASLKKMRASGKSASPVIREC